jgi:hypothetical protein
VQGAIFGLVVHLDLCWSIADDRSVRVWSLAEDETSRLIDTAFGHATRPSAICPYAFTRNCVITAATVRPIITGGNATLARTEASVSGS